MSMKSILVFFHVGSNTGYAIEPLEETFFNMAKALVKDESKIHFGYTNLDEGRPRVIPDSFKNIIRFDYNDSSTESLNAIREYIEENDIKLAFGFDQSALSLPSYRVMRKAGIRCFISYYGAPMSSINTGIKLFLKRLQIACMPYIPDHYIFESKAMSNSAVYGRGIKKSNVSVVYMGVDTDKYQPSTNNSVYAYEKFHILKGRKIIFYSGHMERRKGVHVIVQAAVDLIEHRNRKDVHFVITGNKNGEEKVFDEIYKGTKAEDYITFGGYCDDLPAIIPSCYLGTIASTGWDSFTRSSLEMAACGLPLLVSNLQGLPETIENNKTGLLFEPGDSIELADKIEYLLDNEEIRDNFSRNARVRIMNGFTLQDNVNKLAGVVKQVSKQYL